MMQAAELEAASNEVSAANDLLHDQLAECIMDFRDVLEVAGALPFID
jgi:hypothetical protein